MMITGNWQQGTGNRGLWFLGLCCLLLMAGCGSSSNAPAPGAISVSAQNSSGGSVSASVLLNGESRGNAPLQVSDLTPGTYTLLLQSQGYKDYTTSVVVQSGQTMTVTATMETIPVPDGPVFSKSK